MIDKQQRYFRTPGKQQFSKEMALQKLKHYCGYQERCHSEVKEKLYSFGLRKKEVEEIIAELIEENYLNEERFAKLFAGGKFRMKQWGRLKIKHELKQKQVSEYCINKALKEIDDNAYQQTFEKLALQKWSSLKGEKNIFTKKAKLNSYLLQKGYEAGLLNEVIRSMK